MEYATYEEAENAVRQLNGQVMMSRVIHIRFDRDSVDDPDQGSDIKLFVGNIPWSLEKNDILEHFRSFPPKRIRLMTNMSGRSRGFAILSYSNEDEANEAIKHLNLTNLGGREIEVIIQ